MHPNPDNYLQSKDDIRKLLGLTDDDLVFQYGYEQFLNAKERQEIQKVYDATTLFFRLRPDWLIRKNDHWFFLEFKDKNATTIEATQLFFNKKMAENGINVYYWIDNHLVPVEEIPFNELIIPPKYNLEFTDNILSFVLESFPNLQIKNVRQPKNGSGDPFTPLELGLVRQP